MIDLATALDASRIEAAVNAADRLGLIDVEALRADLDRRSREPGLAVLRRLLDGRTFRLTESELERRFLRLVCEAGLPTPQTQVRLSGYRVDFYWPALGLVVETDGLRYHRTPAQQARDRRRDRALTATGLTVIRFTHGEVSHAPREVVAVLTRLHAPITHGSGEKGADTIARHARGGRTLRGPQG